MDLKMVELDVREDIFNKRRPFHKIMAKIEGFQANDVLVLHVPFEPKPLLNYMSELGFMYECEEITSLHWMVTFTKKGIKLH